MNYRVFTLQLVSLLLIFGLGGCSQEDTPNPQPKIRTQDDCTQLYKEGGDLIRPYMELDGAATRRADTDEDRNQLNRGISLLKKVVQIDSKNWAAYWVMGKGYQALHESENAYDAFGKSFAIQKQHPDVAREFMWECLNLGRVSEAVDTAKYAVRLKPDDAGLLANLALVYLIGGNLDDALPTVEKSLTLAPDDNITQNLRKVILEVRDGQRPQPKSLRDLYGT